MKRSILTISTLILFSLCISSLLVAQSIGIPYGLLKACIEYKIDGTMQSGTEVLYFDKGGLITAKYTSLSVGMAGFTQETKTATFTEGEWIYTVDLTTNTGTKSKNPLFKEMNEGELRDLGKKMMEQMGGKKVGEGEVLNKKCEIWEISSMGSKVWLWNWIPLKTVVDMGGMTMSYIATKISETFDKEKLNKPQNIKYNDIGNAMDLINKYKNIKKD